jgi:hypothetical protein
MENLHWHPAPNESPPKKGRAPGLVVTRAQEDRGKSNESARRTQPISYADENAGWQRIIAIRHLRNIESLLRQLVRQNQLQSWSRS